MRNHPRMLTGLIAGIAALGLVAGAGSASAKVMDPNSTHHASARVMDPNGMNQPGTIWWNGPKHLRPAEGGVTRSPDRRLAGPFLSSVASGGDGPAFCFPPRDPPARAARSGAGRVVNGAGDWLPVRSGAPEGAERRGGAALTVKPGGAPARSFHATLQDAPLADHGR